MSEINEIREALSALTDVVNSVGDVFDDRYTAWLESNQNLVAADKAYNDAAETFAEIEELKSDFADIKAAIGVVQGNAYRLKSVSYKRRITLRREERQKRAEITA